MASESIPRYFSNNHARVFPSVCYPLIKTTIFREWAMAPHSLKIAGGRGTESFQEDDFRLGMSRCGMSRIMRSSTKARNCRIIAACRATA